MKQEKPSAPAARKGAINPARLARIERKPTTPLPDRLWNFAQVCAFFNVSERKGAQMRAAGALPTPVVLGPRVLRWIPAEIMAAAAQAMPRELQQQREPAQLAEARRGRRAAGGAAA
jgi:predicted DNA-binding transcriptional regulator AlpA